MPEVRDADIRVELAPQQANKLCKIRSEFICIICHNVVWEPKECRHDGCDIMCCGRCIDEWWSLSETCPSCKNTDKFKKLNRNLKNQLQEYKF
jgi:hypothetical protein